MERALLQSGIETDKANSYSKELPDGGAFVLVRVAGANVERAVKVMNRFVRTKKRGKRKKQRR